METKIKKQRKFPDTMTLMCYVALFMCILTYIIPAGAYDRIYDEATGRNIVDATSYHAVEQNPVSLLGLLESPYAAMQDGIEIIAFLFVAGGATAVMLKTGAFHAAIGALMRKLKGRDTLFIIVLMIAFSIPASTLGMAEEFIIFVPLLIMVAQSLGYDKITGMAILWLAIYGSLGFPLMGPFSTLIAQSIAEVPLISGFGWRLLGYIGAMAITIQHVLSYAHKTKKDPTKSLIYNKESGSMTLENPDEVKSEFDLDSTELTTKRKVVLLIALAMVAIMAYGVVSLDWYFGELAATFFGAAIVAGVYYYHSFDETIGKYAQGAAELASAALLVGMSRMIVVIITEGCIIDPIVQAMAIPLSHLNGVFAAWGIYVSQLIVNIFVPSSSGQAVVVMPILTPLADILGLDRQVVVNAMVSADCFGNMVIPTHAPTLACVGLAGIPWIKWAKYCLPLTIKWTLWVFAVLTLQVLFG